MHTHSVPAGVLDTNNQAPVPIEDVVLRVEHYHVGHIAALEGAVGLHAVQPPAVGMKHTTALGAAAATPSKLPVYDIGCFVRLI